MHWFMDESEIEARIAEARAKKIQAVMEGQHQKARHAADTPVEEEEVRIPRHFFRGRHFRTLCDRQHRKLTDILMEDWT